MGVKDKAFTWSAATNKAVYGVNSFHTSGYPVKPDDLQSLNESIERWGQFLRHIFLGSSVGYVNTEVLEQYTLEDTELYLDVKIQLSQAMASVQDDILANRLEMICNEIRKNSYKLISSTLPMLNENSRNLVELKDNSGLIKTQSDKTLYVGATRRSVNGGSDHQEGLSLRRKQIMAVINRQHRDVIQNLAQLSSKINSGLYSDEYEL